MSTESDVTTHALRELPDYVELCPNCKYDTSATPSAVDSHRYWMDAFDVVVSHSSVVHCPQCGWSLQRRHQVPFTVLR